MRQELFNAFYETFLMVSVSGIITLSIGFPLGLLLTLTRRGQMFPYPTLNKLAKELLNSAQTLPYVILMIAFMPITSYLVGREEGWFVAILPLSLATIPYFAKQCQQAFNTIPVKLIEFAVFLGATPLQIIRTVFIPESRTQLIQAFTNTLVQLIGYSVIAGLLGAGGLGSLAIQKGYPEFQFSYILATAIILLLFVQSLQSINHYIINKVKL